MSLTIDDLRAASTKAAVCSQRIQIPLRSKVWKGQAGEFAGSGVGSSLDFHDHRNYVPGDDPRYINWQAYARNGQYTMKLYREEVRPLIDLVIDVSPSMFLTDEKAKRFIELFYFIHHSALRVNASLRCTLCSGSMIKGIEAESIISHRWLDLALAMQKGEAEIHAPAIEKTPWRANALHIFISDLLFEGNPQSIIRSLSNRHGIGYIFAPFCNEEAHPDWEGNCDFIDSETFKDHPHRIDSKILTQYIDSYKNHFNLWNEASIRYQVKLGRIPAHGELHHILSTVCVKQGILEVRA